MPGTLTEPGDTVAADFKRIRAAAQTGTISPPGAFRWAEHRRAGGDLSALDHMTGPPWEIRRQWMAAARQPDFIAQLLKILTALGDRVGISLPGSQQPGEPYDQLRFAEMPRPPLARPPQGHVEYFPAPVIYDGDSQGQRRRRSTESWDGYVSAGAAVEEPAAEPGFEAYHAVFPLEYKRRCPGSRD